MKRTWTRLALLPVVAALIPATASAQSAAPPLQLNMRRPPMKSVPPSEVQLSPLGGSAVNIVISVSGVLNPASAALYAAAEAAWEARIPSYANSVTGPVSITITVSEPFIDGAGGILGSAGPSTITSAGGFTLTSTGTMQFDSADVANLIGSGSYDDVIEHEMGHVLGVGTLWTNNGDYVNGTGQYTGAGGLAAWQSRFGGQGAATFVPVELGGGGGTADGHWNEVDGGGGAVGITEISSGIDMQFETMTGWLNAPLNYSALTHLSMADLGYAPAPGAPVEMLSFSVE